MIDGGDASQLSMEMQSCVTAKKPKTKHNMLLTIGLQQLHRLQLA